MRYTHFYREHFKDLCCYEDYLMRIDLLGKKHNDKEVLSSLPKCDKHRYVIAGGEVIWINDNGEKVDNPNITRIPESAFEFCDKVQRIVIPDSVTIIGSWAFYRCKDLESITIPSGVKYIWFGAFFGCENLKSIKVPKGCVIDSLAPADCEVIRY